MPIYTIYKATNTINGKVYIGFDSNWPNRKEQHIKVAKKASKLIFHQALFQDGPDAFEWEAICQSKDGKHLLNEMEPYFIKEYNSFHLNGQGYNMTFGGDGVIGYVHSEESKRKNSESHKGQIVWNKNKKTPPLSEEHKISISKSMKGRPSPLRGRRLPIETRQKMSEARKKYLMERMFQV